MKPVIMYIVYNHNNTEIWRDKDYKNALEEAMDYESYTGNQTSIVEKLTYVEVKE